MTQQSIEMMIDGAGVNVSRRLQKGAEEKLDEDATGARRTINYTISSKQKRRLPEIRNTRCNVKKTAGASRSAR